MVCFVGMKFLSHDLLNIWNTHALAGPTAPPVSVNVTSIDPFTISLWWNEPPLIHQNGIIQFYIVHVLETHTGRFWTIYSVDQPLVVGALHPYYEYECNVAAFTVRAGPLANVTIWTKEACKLSY